MSFIAIQADGAYFVDDDGRETRIPGGAAVNGNGSVTIRVHADDVIVRAPIDPLQCFDLAGGSARRLRLLALLVQRGYLTMAQIQAVRPAVFAVLQAQGVTDGAYTP